MYHSWPWIFLCVSARLSVVLPIFSCPHWKLCGTVIRLFLTHRQKKQTLHCTGLLVCWRDVELSGFKKFSDGGVHCELPMWSVVLFVLFRYVTCLLSENRRMTFLCFWCKFRVPVTNFELRLVRNFFVSEIWRVKVTFYVDVYFTWKDMLDFDETCVMRKTNFHSLVL